MLFTISLLWLIIESSLGCLILVLTLIWLFPAIFFLFPAAGLAYCMKSNEYVSSATRRMYRELRVYCRLVLVDDGDIDLMLVSLSTAGVNVLLVLALIYNYHSYYFVFFRQSVMAGLLFWVFTAKHQESHRVLKPMYKNCIVQRLLGRVGECCTGLMYGNIAGIDRLGHGAIHHSNDINIDHWANNHCSRSNLLHFLPYIIYAGLYHNSGLGLLAHFVTNDQYVRSLRILLGLIVYYSSALLLYAKLDFTLFCYLFLWPFIANIGVASMVNWSWHIFADPADSSSNNYLSSTITIVDIPGDVFNEGYHLIHHLKPGIHYSELNHLFLKRLDYYTAQKAIVLKYFDPIAIFVLVMLQQWGILANNYMNPPNQQWSREEKIAYLKYRTQPLILIQQC
jgi:hypothetical protein